MLSTMLEKVVVVMFKQKMTKKYLFHVYSLNTKLNINNTKLKSLSTTEIILITK